MRNSSSDPSFSNIFRNDCFKLILLFLCVICLSRTVVSNAELNSSDHPLIGRLFKADAVRRVGSSIDNSKVLDNLHSSNNARTQSFINSGQDSHREGKSKSVILRGTKYDIDLSQDKVKKYGYEFSKKTGKRSSSVRGRIKRSVNSNIEKSPPQAKRQQEISDGRRFEGASSTNITNDESLLRKSYIQKAFKRRIEALFADKTGPSGLTEEEVNKSKSLRKQLLNIYVRGKQNKYNAHSNSTSLYNSDADNEGNRPRKPFLRLQIDIPIEDSDDLETIQEMKSEEEKNDLDQRQGRTGRRRIRKILIPLLLALKLKTAVVIALLFGAVKLIALKGLWSGMTALAMVSALALKSLMHGKSSITYEVRAPPPHYHHLPHPHHLHDGYHHGYYHPDLHWSRNDDSYKPEGGWRDGEATDHSTSAVAATLDSTYSTIRTEEVDEQETPIGADTTMDCKTSNSTNKTT